MTGGPVRTVIINGEASFSCGAGPLVGVEKVTDAEVVFTASQSSAAPVTITNGSSAAVGPYQITLLSIDADTAVFKVVVPS